MLCVGGLEGKFSVSFGPNPDFGFELNLDQAEQLPLISRGGGDHIFIVK